MADERAWDDTYWKALVEASPDVILVVDTTGTILFANRLPANESIVGRKIWEFASGDGLKRLTEKLEQVVVSRKAVIYENAGARMDGSPGWYEVRAIPVVIDGCVDRILWASSDVTERKRLEEQLRQAQKIEAIGLFAGGVAHDFNNILAVILASSDFAAKKRPHDAELQVLLTEIADTARRGGDLTRRLLAFSRTQILHPRLVDLAATIADFARMIRRIVGDEVQLVLHEPGAPLTITADIVQLEQVLMNLCTNACQAMPHGGELHLSTRSVDLDARFAAENAWAREGPFAEISVRDTGVGMDATTFARMFEPFFTTKPEGTGLGLPTVHGIVQQHGGFLHVESAPGAGTNFRVYMPRTVGPARAIGAKDEGDGGGGA